MLHILTVLAFITLTLLMLFLFCACIISSKCSEEEKILNKEDYFE